MKLVFWYSDRFARRYTVMSSAKAKATTIAAMTLKIGMSESAVVIS